MSASQNITATVRISFRPGGNEAHTTDQIKEKWSNNSAVLNDISKTQSDPQVAPRVAYWPSEQRECEVIFSRSEPPSHVPGLSVGNI